MEAMASSNDIPKAEQDTATAQVNHSPCDCRFMRATKLQNKTLGSMPASGVVAGAAGMVLGMML